MVKTANRSYLRTQVWFPAHKWRLTIAPNFQFQGDPLLLLFSTSSCAHLLHISSEAHTHTLHINKSITKIKTHSGRRGAELSFTQHLAQRPMFTIRVSRSTSSVVTEGGRR